MHTLKVWIQTPQETLVFEDVEEVSLPGIDGVVGILPNHATMIIGLKAGVVRLSKKDPYFIYPGVASITKEGCLIITEKYEPLAGFGDELDSVLKKKLAEYEKENR